MRVAKTYKTIRAELEAYGHGLDEKPEIVALNKVDAIPERELAKKRAALEKACGHKVHVISGVSGEGITTVLRAMAREINRRRMERAEEAQYGRPARRPARRIERQTVNFNAPVVPKARLVAPQVVKAVAPANRQDRSRPWDAPRQRPPGKLGKPKSRPRRSSPRQKPRPAGPRPSPRRLSKTAQRAKKKQRR